MNLNTPFAFVSQFFCKFIQILQLIIKHCLAGAPAAQYSFWLVLSFLQKLGTHQWQQLFRYIQGC